MKLLSFFLAAILFTVSQFNASANQLELTGDSNTEMGMFSITEQSPVTVKGQNVRAFELKYENSEQPITVLLDENKKSKNYIVRSKNLEIRYECKKNSFGARYVSGKFAKFDPVVNGYFLNSEELKRQEILSNKELSEKEALGIIASFFPQLFKDQRLLK